MLTGAEAKPSQAEYNLEEYFEISPSVPYGIGGLFSRNFNSVNKKIEILKRPLDKLSE